MGEEEIVNEITTTQIWQLIIAFICPFIIIIFANIIEKRLWIFTKFDRINKGKSIQLLKNTAEKIIDNLGIIVIIEIISMYIYIIAIFTIILGTEFLMQSIVFSAALVIFMTFQLPRLLKPNLHISLLPCDSNSFYIKPEELQKPSKELELPSDSKTWFALHVTNLGINNYEQLRLFVTFDKKLQPIPSKYLLEVYQKMNIVIDPENLPYYQQPQNMLIWKPQNIIAYDEIIYSACVKTPEKEGRYPITVELSSATRWGNVKKIYYLNIKKELPLDHQTI